MLHLLVSSAVNIFCSNRGSYYKVEKVQICCKLVKYFFCKVVVVKLGFDLSCRGGDQQEKYILKEVQMSIFKFILKVEFSKVCLSHRESVELSRLLTFYQNLPRGVIRSNIYSESKN